MTYKCPDCGHGINFNHQGCKIKMTLTKLIELQAAATPGPWELQTVQTSCGIVHKIGPFPYGRGDEQNHACIYADYINPGPLYNELAANARLMQAARNFDFAALDEKIKRYEEALRYIAERHGFEAVPYDVKECARKALEGME